MYFEVAHKAKLNLHKYNLMIIFIQDVNSTHKIHSEIMLMHKKSENQNIYNASTA